MNTKIGIIAIALLISGCASTSSNTSEKSYIPSDTKIYLDEETFKKANGDFDLLYTYWVEPTFGELRSTFSTARFNKMKKQAYNDAFEEGFISFCETNKNRVNISSDTTADEPAKKYTCVDNNNQYLSFIKISDNWHVFKTKNQLEIVEKRKSFMEKRKDYSRQEADKNGPTGTVYFSNDPNLNFKFSRIGDLGGKDTIFIVERDLPNFTSYVREFKMEDVREFNFTSEGLATYLVLRDGTRYEIAKDHNLAVFQVDKEGNEDWFEGVFIAEDEETGEHFLVKKGYYSIKKIIIDDPASWKNKTISSIDLNKDVFLSRASDFYEKEISNLNKEFEENGWLFAVPKPGSEIKEHLASSVDSKLSFDAGKCRGYEHTKAIEAFDVRVIQRCYQARKELPYLRKGYPLSIEQTPLAYYYLLSTIKDDIS